MKPKEMNPACRQLIIDHHKWINSFTQDSKSHQLPCIFSNIMEQAPAYLDMETGDFQAKRRRLTTEKLVRTQQCMTHAAACRCDRAVHIDFSGLPCPDNSKANRNRLFEEGASGKIYITWAAVHRAKRTPLLVLENVPESCLHACAPMGVFNLMHCAVVLVPGYQDFCREGLVGTGLPGTSSVSVTCRRRPHRCDEEEGVYLLLASHSWEVPP